MHPGGKRPLTCWGGVYFLYIKAISIVKFSFKLVTQLIRPKMAKNNIKTPGFYSVYDDDNLSSKSRGSRRVFTDAKPTPGPSQADRDDFAHFLEEIDSISNTARTVRDALIKHASYQLISIKTVTTKFGSRQIWCLRFSEDDDMPHVLIWAPKVLARYVVTDDTLDLVKVECLKGYRIIYNGYTEDASKSVNKYEFSVMI